MDEDLKARLLKARVPEGTVELGGIGTVRVRGLSRREVAVIQGQNLGWVAFERKVIVLGMVDPVMSEDDVAQWQEGSPAGELEAVSQKIQELSGLQGKASEKAAYAQFRGEPGAGVRDVPGAEAGDDGGPTAGADE